jgi:hypothetical protein
MVIKHQNQLEKMVDGISLSISPFLMIDANTNQNKYKVQKSNYIVILTRMHKLLKWKQF